jgi:hypothetical protein
MFDKFGSIYTRQDLEVPVPMQSAILLQLERYESMHKDGVFRVFWTRNYKVIWAKAHADLNRTEVVHAETQGFRAQYIYIHIYIAYGSLNGMSQRPPNANLQKKRTHIITTQGR